MPYYRCASCGLTGYSPPAHATSSVCANCAASLRDATRLFVTPGTVRGVERVLAAAPAAAAKARREVTVLPLPQEARGDLTLVVSELVTNAVVHGGSTEPVRLAITMLPDRARVEVRDGGRGFDVPSSDDSGGSATGGQGLVIVAALSDSWGVKRDSDGCTVWCEVFVDRPAPSIEWEIPGAHLRELAIEMAEPQAARSA